MIALVRLSLLFSLLLFLFCGRAWAMPVDLSSFNTIDPSVTVFGADNDSAQILEDPFLAPVGLWETALAIPADAGMLIFDYRLEVLVGNEDYFDFYFGDLVDPVASFGGFEGLYAGTITRSLSGFTGGLLPLAFALNFGFGDGGFDSILTIENVQITQGQVPESSTLALLTVGLVLLPGLRRARNKI